MEPHNPETSPRQPPISRAKEPSQVSGSSSKAFSFVTTSNRSQIRSHAMRESWRQRKLREGAQVERYPTLAAKAPTNDDDETSKDDRLQPSDQIFLDTRYAVRPPFETDSRPDWRVSNVPTALHRRPSPYQTISRNDELDPFNFLDLDREDQGLLYHCKPDCQHLASSFLRNLGSNEYAHQAFGQPIDPTFDPMRDLYRPIDLTEIASVHAILAHAASHQAYLRREKTSFKAISHKLKAIQLINEDLSDPVRSVSDETFSAVLRLLTLERYWGTERTWKLHRAGLAQLVKKRGGFSTFPANWRLEMRLHLVELNPAPRWNPAFTTPPFPSATSTIPEEENYETPHSNFINFFQDISPSSLPPSTYTLYPCLQQTLSFLHSPLPLKDNEDRLLCLFYIAIILKDSKGKFDLRWLEESLRMTEDVWRGDVGSLRWLLLQGMGRGNGGGKDGEADRERRRVESLGWLAKGLKENRWRRMEDRLLGMILSDGGNGEEEWAGSSDIGFEGSSTLVDKL